MQLPRHAADKLETYGIDGARLESWRAALKSGDPFLDGRTGSLVLVIHWEERPWIVILSKDGDRVVTTYPSDERTVINRRGGGRHHRFARDKSEQRMAIRWQWQCEGRQTGTIRSLGSIKVEK